MKAVIRNEDLNLKSRIYKIESFVLQEYPIRSIEVRHLESHEKKNFGFEGQSMKNMIVIKFGIRDKAIGIPNSDVLHLEFGHKMYADKYQACIRAESAIRENMRKRSEAIKKAIEGYDENLKKDTEFLHSMTMEKEKALIEKLEA